MSEAPTSGINKDMVPVVCEAVDIMDLDITAEEGFILSRIDGISRVSLILELSGLGEEKTGAILDALRSKGIVVFRDPGAELDPEVAEQCALDEELARESVVYTLDDIRGILRKGLPKGDELIPVIEAIFVYLEQLSYYDLLGVSMSAGPKQIKKAYILRTKYFHPDKFYRKVNIEFRDKVQEIFKQANKGYKVLSDPEARVGYDKSLELEEEDFGEEEEITIEAAPRSQSRARGVKGASPWKQVRVSKQKPVEEKVRKKRPGRDKPQGPKLKLGLKGGSKTKSPLMRKIEEMKKQEGGDEASKRAERFYKGAMMEKDRGNFGAAEINLKLAVQYAPGDRKYKQALEDLKLMEDQSRAEAEFKAGLESHKLGDLSGGLRHYRQALKLGFETAKLYYKLAELIMELESDYERARSLVLKAIEMEPGVADYHIALARAYKGLGQKAAAIVQLEKVLKLDPKNKVIAKELKALKRK